MGLDWTGMTRQGRVDEVRTCCCATCFGMEGRESGSDSRLSGCAGRRGSLDSSFAYWRIRGLGFERVSGGSGLGQ